MRTIVIALVLLALWLLMSGVYKPLTIGLGVASVVLVVFVMRRMDIVDQDRPELHLKFFGFFAYFGWLLVEIARANWAVTKVILSPEMPIRQHLFPVKYSQRSDVGQVIFANSITLTPGTITVEIEPKHFFVHALAFHSHDIVALADMDARVTATESGAA